MDKIFLQSENADYLTTLFFESKYVEFIFDENGTTCGIYLYKNENVCFQFFEIKTKS